MELSTLWYGIWILIPIMGAVGTFVAVSRMQRVGEKILFPAGSMAIVGFFPTLLAWMDARNNSSTYLWDFRKHHMGLPVSLFLLAAQSWLLIEILRMRAPRKTKKLGNATRK